jgi:hypothetical protein
MKTMGDRGNIVIVQHAGPDEKGLLYLYSHWGGSNLPKHLQAVLKRGQRLGDEPYLTRLIAREMGMGEEGETGYGITTYLTDNEYPLLIVDAKQKTVSVSKEDTPMEPYKTVSFKAFCELSEQELTEFRGSEVED